MESNWLDEEPLLKSGSSGKTGLMGSSPSLSSNLVPLKPINNNCEDSYITIWCKLVSK